tara:strand:+ start:1912 stop:2271 length:360 start_codon:yes stop_codon:yes gene_type:complete
MSICTPCTKTLPIAYCATSVYVADWIAGVGVSVNVYTKNTANGRLNGVQVTTDVDGKISIPFVSRVVDVDYEVWVNSDAASMFDKDAVYLPNKTDEVTCIAVRFEKLNGVAVAEAIVSE